jgi:2-oxoisovalerate dehydrogenase E2 component (dihydrolipoyl transacylase)
MVQRVVKVPDIGEGTTEAEIVAWHVKVGDTVAEDDPVADVMTDKATVEIPAPESGTIIALYGEVGEKRPVGSELVVLETDPRAARAAAAATAAAPHPGPRPASGEREGAALSKSPAPPAGRVRGPRAAPEGEGQTPPGPVAERWVAEGRPAAVVTPVVRTRPLGAKPLASPAVRKRAWDLGIPLQFVPGSGPEGRITRADLDAYAAAGGAAAAPGPLSQATAPEDAVESVPVIGLRRTIAERLQQSKRNIPHFSYIEEVDVGAVEDLRGQLNAAHPERPHLTLLAFLLRAIVRAAAAHPQVNARFDDESGILHRHRAVHAGIATQTEAGLMVPVVRHAETLDPWRAAAEIARLADAARQGKATREELIGSTITITSLGRLGGIAATPVINRPEVAIVGVNKIAERPVVRGGSVVIARMMNLSSSFDHRIVDGWVAAAFIQHIKNDLEHPAMMFID